MHTKKEGFPKERRRSARHYYTNPVSLAVLGDSHNPPNDIKHSIDAIDISDSGMRINISRTALRKGAMIKMQIPMPDAYVRIPVLAEVIWLKEKKPEIYQVGLKFLLE
ncbi:MAG: PilZ domain-containing protein [bacterium]